MLATWLCVRPKNKVGTLATERRRIFSLVHSRVDRANVPPAHTRVTRHLKFHSPGTTRRRLGTLTHGNIVRVISNTSHKVHLLRRRRRKLPLMNHITTNRPLLTRRRVRNRCRISPSLFGPGTSFLLHIDKVSVGSVNVVSNSLLTIRGARSMHGNRIIITHVSSRIAIGHLGGRNGGIRLLPRGDRFGPVIISLHRRDFAVRKLTIKIVHGNS